MGFFFREEIILIVFLLSFLGIEKELIFLLKFYLYFFLRNFWSGLFLVFEIEGVERDLFGLEFMVFDLYLILVWILVGFWDLGIIEGLRVLSFGYVDFDGVLRDEGWREKCEMLFVSREVMDEVWEKGLIERSRRNCWSCGNGNKRIMERNYL